MTESVALSTEVRSVSLGVLQADRPAQLVEVATEAANALAKVIKSRQLYSSIQGKQYVKCEGWTTLAAMLGCTPCEISCVEGPEGTFVATVELRRLTDGQVVARASAECGMDEPTWAKRARYARRSMALTRATAKACRMAFSWVMALSGYEVTPAEEIPAAGDQRGVPKVRSAAPPSAADLAEVPEALKTPEPDPLMSRWKERPITALTSLQLLQLRTWARKQKDLTPHQKLLDDIDTVLASREGE